MTDRRRQGEIPTTVLGNPDLSWCGIEPPPGGARDAQEGERGRNRPDGPATRQERAPQPTTQDEVARCLLQLEPIMRASGLTADQQRSVQHMARMLATGDRQALNALNRWCRNFENNPEELRTYFNNLAGVLQRLGINAEVKSEVHPNGRLAAAMLDLPCGNGNWLRLSSDDNPLILSEGTSIQADGTETRVLEARPGRSPYGAARIIARALVDRARERRGPPRGPE